MEIEYMILEEKFCEDLVKAVEEYLELGWEPLGGVTVAAGGLGTYGGYRTYYCQAMTRKTNKESDE
jgi:hypothetical protein